MAALSSVQGWAEGMATELLELPPAAAIPADGAAEMSDAAAEAAYDEARRNFLSATENVSDSLMNGGSLPEVVVMSDPNRQVVRGGERADTNVALKDVRVVVDVDNSSLREVIGQVIAQGAQYTGAWTVKWRLKPENASLLDERVNLTAEGSFERFMTLLIERVKNMSGVQLFVKEFPESRVILIADTYY